MITSNNILKHNPITAAANAAKVVTNIENMNC